MNMPRRVPFGSAGLLIGNAGLFGGYPDMELTRLEIQIVPLESEQFPVAQSGEEIDKEQLKEAIRLCLKEETPHLVLRQGLHLPRFLRRELAAVSGIAAEQSVLERLFQRGLAADPAGPHRTVGQPFPVDFTPDQSASGFQIGIEFLKIVRCNIVEQKMADGGDDVLVDAVLVTCRCGRAQPRF